MKPCTITISMEEGEVKVGKMLSRNKNATCKFFNLSAMQLNFCFYYEFIRQIHQSRIPNLRFFLTNVYYDFFFNWQTEEKKLFWTNKSLFSFSTAQTEKYMWKKFVKQIGENI